METAAVVHDIGILTAERKYDSSAGKYQELEGPAEAKDLLSGLGWPQEVIDRVCYLVRHHHTYANIDEPDYQILVEADFLVNLLENHLTEDAQKSAYDKIFRTKTFSGCFIPVCSKKQYNFVKNKKGVRIFPDAFLQALLLITDESHQ